MRIKDALVPIAIHNGVNNNQIDHQSSETASGSKIIDDNKLSSSEKNNHTGDYNKTLGYEIQGFRVAEDTTRWSSVAVARSNVNNSKRINNNINNNINTLNNINNNINNNNNSNNNNNNLNVSRLSLSSSADSLSDYEAHEYSAGSDCSDNSEDNIIPGHCRGIINPNYPGFQHLGSSFLSIFADEDQPDNNLSSKTNEQDSINIEVKNNNNNNIDSIKKFESVNRLDNCKGKNKFFHEKSKLNIQAVSTFYDGVVSSSEKCLNYVKSIKDSHNEKIIVTPCNSNEIIDNNYLQPWNHNQPIEFEVAELQSSLIELPQFPEIEKIPSDTVNNCEQEEVLIKQMDLITEITNYPQMTNNALSSTKNINDNEITESDTSTPEQQPYTKLEEIDLLSSIGRDIGVDLEKYVQPVPDVVAMEPLTGIIEDTNKFIDDKKIDTTIIDCRKKEKMTRNHQARRRQRKNDNKYRQDAVDKVPGSFDIYNIETAMPKIDLDVIESHLRAAREEERRFDEEPDNYLVQDTNEVKKITEPIDENKKSSCLNTDRGDLLTRFDRIIRGDNIDEQRRNDREEIRKRLAMGPDADDIRTERGKKPSLQSRLQSGMNLQICFMNETPSDNESPSSETESSPSIKKCQKNNNIIKQTNIATASRPQILNLPSLRLEKSRIDGPIDEADFFARQARLQTEARMALAQAKEMAHMQMEVERQRLTQSPITEMVRSSLEKVGVQLGEDRRRLSRVLLTELNVAQLQVVANDLHARIAVLNEALVEGLLRRDDLHMEQDSMLVDVEDLTRYLGSKESSFKKRQIIVEQSSTIVGKHRYLAQQKITFIKNCIANHNLVNFVRK